MLDDRSGSGRRKPVRWASAERAAIMAETYQPVTTVAEVARKHGIVASQLSSWRTMGKRKGARDKGHKSAFTEISMIKDALPISFDVIEVVCGAVLIRPPKSATP